MSVLGRAIALLLLVLVSIGGTVTAIAFARVHRVHAIPYPPIARAVEPAEIARGGRLFRTACFGCHAGAPDGDRPLGARVTGAPSFLGEMWAPNLTSDPVSGIGGWTDFEVARLLRNGLRRDGMYAAAMPRFARLADSDVAALLGFLRSPDPMLAATAADGTRGGGGEIEAPRSRLSLVGTLVVAFGAGMDTSGPAHVPAPARRPTAEYGRYLATSVYGCVECHTEGYAPVEQKLRAPYALAGGLDLRTPRNEPIYSANLTFDARTGLASSARDDAAFRRILTTGIGHDGLPLRPPMPVFRFLDDGAEHVDARALLAFLRTVPPVPRATPPPIPPREVPRDDDPPERLFAVLGCAMCHGEGATRRDDLRRARTRPIPEIVVAIRHPEARRPGTPMPTYAASGVVSDAMVTKLALWIQATAAH